MVSDKVRRSAGLWLAFAVSGWPAAAQNMLNGVDLSAPAFTASDMTRSDIEALIKTANGKPLDLSGKSLNKLDLAGLDLTKANLRVARLNGANLAGARLDGAILDQVWAIKADFRNASLRGASLFASQLQGANLDSADLTGARAAGDFTGASLRGTVLEEADLSADTKNQSMGLMRMILAEARLEGANFSHANMSRANVEFAHFSGANLEGASLAGANAAGADFRGALLAGTDFKGADITSAHISKEQADPAFSNALNLARALKD